MSKFKKTFTLKQHTPIIHFQSEQRGATLRASELKPKFDRFLITKLGRGDYKTGKEMAKDKGWLIGKGEHPALDYKVKIEQNRKKFEKNDRDLVNYFGNQGKGPKKYGRFNYDIFKLEITSFHTDLIKNLKDNFAQFLATHNFGTRQSKGYGSFYLDSSSEGYKDIGEVLDKETWYMEIDTTDSKLIDEAIKYFWNRLKSGINLHFSKDDSVPNELYKHSYTKIYACNHNVIWEKRWIKQTFFGLKPKDTEAFFVRALLGLSSTFSYTATKEPNNPYKKINIKNDFTIEVVHNSIARIPAPILFKPIIENNKTKIFLLVNTEHIEKILTDKTIDKEFYFSIFWGKGDRKKPKRDRKNKDYYFVYKNDLDDKDYKEFIDAFWDKVPNGFGQYKPKFFNLPLPAKFDFSKLLEQYINDELDKKFDAYYFISKGKLGNINVTIKRTQDAN